MPLCKISINSGCSNSMGWEDSTASPSSALSMCVSGSSEPKLRTPFRTGASAFSACNSMTSLSKTKSRVSSTSCNSDTMPKSSARTCDASTAMRGLNSGKINTNTSAKLVWSRLRGAARIRRGEASISNDCSTVCLKGLRPLCARGERSSNENQRRMTLIFPHFGQAICACWTPMGMSTAYC